MNIELLKKEVLQTICIYIDAMQPENQNWNFICDNNIHAGICAYTKNNELNYLNSCISKFNYHNDYIFSTPWNIHYIGIQLSFFDCHIVRFKYLVKILQEIIYIEQMKQEGKIYTYYNLISLFKF